MCKYLVEDEVLEICCQVSGSHGILRRKAIECDCDPEQVGHDYFMAFQTAVLLLHAEKYVEQREEELQEWEGDVPS